MIAPRFFMDLNASATCLADIRHRNHCHSRISGILAFCLGLLLFCAMLLASAARAQDAPPPPLLNGGDGVITGFSGTVEQAGKPFIDLDGAAAKIMALSRTGPAWGQLEMPPVRREIPTRETGQVFGIAIDNLVPANVYLGATAAFGLRIVTPDADGDGIPEIALKGQPDAQWMEGQWGPGGGPGSIWKVNGATGVVELFATLPNSGPGIGNIAYDHFRYQLFASNLDDGLIYRLDLNGNILDTYDHGQTGRAAAGMTPVADDGRTADITSPAFSVENTNTWGLTDIRRQVWGLAVRGDRLYYAVATGPDGGPQIWSVGINIDGSLANDARVEIAAVPGGLPVSDMLFTPSGRMILAQRGMLLNSLDNTRFHIPGADRVLRYRRDPKTGQWIQEPQEYAVGFPRPYRNASGGVALSCAGRLWVSGDQLRNDPEVVPDPPFVVHGLQRMFQRLVKPRNMPPFSAVFVDYDGRFGDAQNAGHVGDVEVYRDCIGWPRPPRGWLPPMKDGVPTWTPPDLFKQGLECVRDAETGDLLCDYAIYAYNWKKAPRTGGMIFYDIPGADVSFDAMLGASFSVGGSLGFSCSQPGGPGTPIKCESSGSFSLDFGAFVELKLRTRIPAAAIAVELPIGEEAWKLPALANCVAWEPDGTPGACTVPTPKDPWPVPKKDLVFCEKQDDGSTDCTVLLTFRNAGAGTFNGIATITDNVGPGVTLVGDSDGFDTDGFTPLSWTCTQAGGAGTPIECSTDNPVTVGSGEQVDVLVTVKIPADAEPEAWRDCAMIDEHGPKACIDKKEPPRLTPEKERSECKKGPDGITCTYRLRIRNDGPGVHEGPLSITDSVGPAATLAGDSDGNGPDGPVSWTCSQAGGAGTNITCTSYAPVRLDPGESAHVDITITYPADAKEEDIADCAFIEPGGPDACLPGNIEKPKLDLGKALEGCKRDGHDWVCTYAITITNTGGGAFSGPLNFSDDVGPQTTYVSHAPAADWTCSQPSGMGGDIACNSNAPVNLPAGGSRTVTITTRTPLGLDAKNYRDCAQLKVDGHEGRECVDAPPPPPPPAKPKLERTKALKNCRMDGESLQCSFIITITNTGSAPFSGTLRFLDMAANGSWTYQSTITPGWNCTQATTGSPVHCSSTAPQNLAPGASQTVEITLSRPGEPDGDRTSVNNCVLKYDRGHERSCVEVKIPVPEWQKKLKECVRKDNGVECTFTFTMRNTGEADYVGLGSFTDYPSAGGVLVSSNPPAGWGCRQIATGSSPAIRCESGDDITIPPGGAVSGELTIRYPGSEKAPFNCWFPYHLDDTKRCIDVKVPPEPQPVCPPGTTGFPKGTQLPQGFVLVETLNDGTQCARYRLTQTPVPVPVPPLTTPKPHPTPQPPRCNAGERTLTTRAAARDYQRRGWSLRRVQRDGITRWCAAPPVRANCKPGWQPLSGADLRPLKRQGWRFYSIKRRGRVVLWCGKPPVVRGCPKGWQSAMPNPNFYRERGWQVRRFGNEWCMKPTPNTRYCRAGGRVLQNYDEAERLRRQGWSVDFVRGPGPDGTPYWCIYGPPRQCPKGYKPVKAAEVGALRRRGWTVRRGGRVWCARPPVAKPQCPDGWRQVPSRDYALQRGWQARFIRVPAGPAATRGIWCARPGKQPPVLSCPQGMQQVSRQRFKLWRQRGWPTAAVRRNGRVLYCGRRGEVSRPCPKGMKRVGNRCVRIDLPPRPKPCPKGQVRRGNRCVPVVRPCPKGMKRVGNRCVRIDLPPRPKPCPKGQVHRGNRCVPVVRPCPKGMKRVGNRCVRIERPRPRACPKGTVRTNKGCVPVRIDPRALHDIPRQQKPPTLY